MNILLAERNALPNMSGIATVATQALFTMVTIVATATRGLFDNDVSPKNRDCHALAVPISLFTLISRYPRLL
jgi:hypothetical protein